jgi:hypothetical protein
MRLACTTHQGRDTGDRDDTPTTGFLRGHLVCNGTGDVETSIHVDVLHFFPERVGHVEERVERADTGVGDENVDSVERFDGFCDDLRGWC